MTHGGNSKGIIMRRPDGTPMTRSEVIVQRRGALVWLPVLFSNDLVHGSWWFVIGSAVTMLFSMYPLIQKYSGNYDHSDDVLPATDYDVTWILLIISGFFFTLGSLAFVRAFEEPPKRPMFYNHKHFQTDELLGAWLFLLGTAPSIPYLFLFFIFDPSAFYFFGTVASIIFTYATYLFVAACYPSDKVHKNYVLPMMIRLLGPQLWIVKHLANDWLAGTWFFLWANGLAAFACVIILFISFGLGDAAQIFIWLSSAVSSILFLIGSAYFVSGSYPHAQQFYYAEGRGHIEKDPAFMETHEDDGDEETGDTVKLLPVKPTPQKSKIVMDSSKKLDDKPGSLPVEKKTSSKPSAGAASASVSKNDVPEKHGADRKKMMVGGGKSPVVPASPSVPSKDHRPQPSKLTPSSSSSSAAAVAALTAGTTDSNPTLKKAVEGGGQDDGQNAFLPPPPPPAFPPMVVPDENQDDDDDDVDVVEENSSMMMHGPAVTAADLVDKQHRRRSAALGARNQFDDLLTSSSTEASPEKLLSPPGFVSNENEGKQQEDEEEEEDKESSASESRSLLPPPAGDVKKTNVKSPPRNKKNKNPEKPIRRPQGPPPPAPTL